MKFRVFVEVDLVKGPEQDEETVLDAFAASLGRSNGAPSPFRFWIGDPEFGPETAALYEVKLVDDRQ